MPLQSSSFRSVMKGTWEAFPDQPKTTEGSLGLSLLSGSAAPHVQM